MKILKIVLLTLSVFMFIGCNEEQIKAELVVTETIVPVVETIVPVVEVTEPAVETTTPVAEVTEPAVETTEPAVETTAPVTETIVPVAETTVPVAETTVPVAETTVPVVETTTPVATTNEKIVFKDIESSVNDGLKSFTITDETEYKILFEEKSEETIDDLLEEILSPSNSLSSNTIQGELSLKQWLFSNIDHWDVYIIDEDGNYLEYYSQLEYGKTYTIIDEEFKFNELVMLAEHTFVFSEEYDGKAFVLELDLVDFDMKFNFDIDGEELSYTWVTNHSYEFQGSSGDNYKVYLDYSNVYKYLTTDELTFVEFGNIGGVTWDYSNYDYLTALDGFKLSYDSVFDETKIFQFTFDVDEDCRIRIDDNPYLLSVSIDGKILYSNDIILSGSKVTVIFENHQELNAGVFIVPLEDIIEPACDEIMEILGLCPKVDISFSVADKFGFDDYKATVQIIADNHTDQTPIFRILEIVYEENDGSVYIHGEENIDIYIDYPYYLPLVANDIGEKVIKSITFEVRFEGDGDQIYIEPYEITIETKLDLGTYSID